MINATSETTPKASPELVKLSDYMKDESPATQGVGSATTTEVTPASTPPSKKKVAPRTILGIALLAVLVLGLVAVIFGTQISQELRRRAVTNCDIYNNNQAACDAQDPCVWNQEPDTCPAPVNKQCTTPGCTYNSVVSCTGSGLDCGVLTTASSCTAAPGCTWQNNISECSGTVVCSSITDTSQCIAEYNCQIEISDQCAGTPTTGLCSGFFEPEGEPTPPEPPSSPGICTPEFGCEYSCTNAYPSQPQISCNLEEEDCGDPRAPDICRGLQTGGNCQLCTKPSGGYACPGDPLQEANCDYSCACPGADQSNCYEKGPGHDSGQHNGSYDCKNVQIDVIRNGAHVWNCTSQSGHPWSDCAPPSQLQCNDQCTSDAQCQATNSNWFCEPTAHRCRLQSNPGSTSCQPAPTTVQCNEACGGTATCAQGLVCIPAFNFSGSFANVTSNITEGQGTINGFRSYKINSTTISQHYVRGGQIWYRPNFGSQFQNVTSNITFGSGEITSINSDVKADGTTRQYVVRGGQIWYRPNFSSNFENVTSNVDGIGSGTITSYSAEETPQNVTYSYLVRGGQIWFHDSTNWNNWQNVTSNVSTIGSGTITDFNVYMNTDGGMGQYLVRGGQIWYRLAPVIGDRCRLQSNPNSSTCTPVTQSLQCNSDCTSNAQCSAVNPAWSCVSNKCRLTANPSSTTCEAAPEAPMCKDVAILDQNNNELDPKAVPSSFYIGQIIKLRCAADNPSSPLIQKYQFRITRPNGVVVETALNPTGTTAISLPYTIQDSGTFKAQCRICLTDNSCQPYIDIPGTN